MSTIHTRAIRWSLIVLGIGTVVISEKIVIPGLELLLGIETIVGQENVVYEPDGTYMYTNPGAMVCWVVLVAALGVKLACGGGLLLFRGRRTRLK